MWLIPLSPWNFKLVMISTLLINDVLWTMIIWNTWQLRAIVFCCSVSCLSNEGKHNISLLIGVSHWVSSSHWLLIWWQQYQLDIEIQLRHIFKALKISQELGMTVVFQFNREWRRKIDYTVENYNNVFLVLIQNTVLHGDYVLIRMWILENWVKLFREVDKTENLFTLSGMYQS